jgi:dolichyl-diphosphooligosaccharide--protein glycosyltransferase
MVASWGGYAFIINIIPIFTLYLTLADKLTSHAYVAYTTFYTVGTLLAM